uniref:Tc1-like transposase DDE domain-containing protein n=1 Tax=Mycena chlorophos TaxID=658473 RepID=A0ABQ0KYI5_MYCCL|nr:predicted protein [Mycena chlorophos]
MPAISNRSKAATSRIHSRQTTQDAVDRTRDPDYEPEPTPSFISAEHEKKKRSLNADQVRGSSVAHIRDFKAEKPLLQVLIEKRGHICLFLPKFHCELNPIEMVWAELKRYFRDHADGTFPKAKKLVPKGLDRISIDTIRRFFRHCNRYRSAYQLGLNP